MKYYLYEDDYYDDRSYYYEDDEQTPPGYKPACEEDYDLIEGEIYEEEY